MACCWVGTCQSRMLWFDCLTGPDELGVRPWWCHMGAGASVPHLRRTVCLLPTARHPAFTGVQLCFCVCVTGILLWSLALVREGNDLAGGVLFAVLLNMKHLFACLAPVYFVYLLRHHCRRASAQVLIEGCRIWGM